MKQVTIPASVEKAGTRLAALDHLATATEWERAAIVAAFVDTADKDGGRKPATSSRLSPNQFAALKFAGLRSKDTVRRYHDAWMTRQDVYERPTPGDTFDLDALPDWAETVGPVDGRTAIERQKELPGNVAKALEDPEFAAKVAARSTAKAKRNAARHMVDDTALDDIHVKQGLRQKVVKHDATNRAASDAKGTNTEEEDTLSMMGGALAYGQTTRGLTLLWRGLREAETWADSTATPDDLAAADESLGEIIEKLKAVRRAIKAVAR